MSTGVSVITVAEAYFRLSSLLSANASLRFAATDMPGFTSYGS